MDWGSVTWTDIIQAASALAIAALTWRLATATRDYVDSTDRIVTENKNLIKTTAQATIFYDTLPILDIPEFPELLPPPGIGVSTSSIEGSWKNIGRGPALEVEMGVTIDGSLRLTNDVGQAEFRTEWRVGLAPGDRMPFWIPVSHAIADEWPRAGAHGIELLVRYRDLHGNHFISHHAIGKRSPTAITLVHGEVWEQGIPIGNLEYNPETGRLEQDKPVFIGPQSGGNRRRGVFGRRRS